MNDTLSAIVLVLKNACFNVVTVLTVLVALGNELKRWNMAYRWLEERHDQLRQWWYYSLGVFIALSALYSGLQHEPGPLVIDVLTIAAMVGGVFYLQQRKTAGGSREEILEDRTPFDERTPRRSNRVPRERRRREPRSERRRFSEREGPEDWPEV